jgi:hypothetical protein
MIDVRWITGFLDSPTREAESFWLAVTGTTMSARRAGGTFATLLPAGGDAFLRVQVVGDGPPRGHLDLHVPEVTAGVAVGLGAHPVRHQDGLVLLRSPAGVPFCLVKWHGETGVPAPIAWPGGQRSVVDQLCLDIPEPVFEAEARFWSALTGWAREPVGSPEFERLRRDPRLPAGLLLQRVGSGTAGVHVDFACDDVAAEVARHVELGARFVRSRPGSWTTLRDPVGRDYCVTARSPRA